MKYNKIRDFLKSLSIEIDSLVVKAGVIKIIFIIALYVLLNLLIGKYFHDFLFKFHLLSLLITVFFIISLEENSKIKYLGVWIGSMLAVIFSIITVFVLIYGIGESLIKIVYGWFS